PGGRPARWREAAPPPRGPVPTAADRRHPSAQAEGCSDDWSPRPAIPANRRPPAPSGGGSWWTAAAETPSRVPPLSARDAPAPAEFGTGWGRQAPRCDRREARV